MTAEDVSDPPPSTERSGDADDADTAAWREGCARDSMLTIAREAVGLSFAEATRERYVAALFPDEEPRRAYEMARTMSSCGLFVRACWWLWGCQDARLHAPYQPGRVMVDLIEIAKECDAWRTPKTVGEVQPGDAIFIGGPEHVLLVEEYEDATGDPVIVSIDGGQKEDGRNYGIARRVRALRNGSLVSAGGTPRVVQGWVCWEKVAERFG